jgi:hypothetical protein
MSNIDSLIKDFLAQKRLAVVGVSRTKPGSASLNYRKLREAGYKVYAVNPNTTEFEGDPCYPDLKSIPDALDGVLIFTNAQQAENVVKQCVELKIPRVWMHCALGSNPKFFRDAAAKIGSASAEAVKLCRDNNIAVIAGGCPMMFYEDADGGHAFMGRMLHWMGHFSEN